MLVLGCAFVTYQDRAAADKAILALHDVKCIPPMTNPLQVRYAEGELEKIGLFPSHVINTLKLLISTDIIANYIITSTKQLQSINYSSEWCPSTWERINCAESLSLLAPLESS